MSVFSLEQVRPGLFCIHSLLNPSNKPYSQDDSVDKKEGVGNPLTGVPFGNFPNQFEKLQVTASTPREATFWSSTATATAGFTSPMGIIKRDGASETPIKFNPPVGSDSQVIYKFTYI